MITYWSRAHPRQNCRNQTTSDEILLKLSGTVKLNIHGNAELLESTGRVRRKHWSFASTCTLRWRNRFSDTRVFIPNVQKSSFRFCFPEEFQRIETNLARPFFAISSLKAISSYICARARGTIHLCDSSSQGNAGAPIENLDAL